MYFGPWADSHRVTSVAALVATNMLKSQVNDIRFHGDAACCLHRQQFICLLELKVDALSLLFKTLIFCNTEICYFFFFLTFCVNPYRIKGQTLGDEAMHITTTLLLSMENRHA